jgi:hypothetical protein
MDVPRCSGLSTIIVGATGGRPYFGYHETTPSMKPEMLSEMSLFGTIGQKTDSSLFFPKGVVGILNLHVTGNCMRLLL